MKGRSKSRHPIKGPRQGMSGVKEALIQCLFSILKRTLLLLFVPVSAPVVAAPLIEQLRPLTFGTLAVPGNASVLNLVVSHDGPLQVAAGLVVVALPEAGRYRLSGFPANVGLEVSVTDAELTAGGSGLPEKFTATLYNTPTVFAGPDGSIEFSLGATLRSSGSGNPYIDAPYSGSATMSVRYWSSAAGGYLTAYETIDLMAVAQTSISLLEEQGLHFGTLFARAAAADQAVLTLAPDGAISIENPGNSRLVQLSSGTPGLLRVIGAAPHYVISIHPQPGVIELRHETIPGQPRFLVSDFVTSPANSGVTNSAGELLLRVGATLRTALTAGDPVYPPGKYTGTYELTVSY